MGCAGLGSPGPAPPSVPASDSDAPEPACAVNATRIVSPSSSMIPGQVGLLAPPHALGALGPLFGPAL